MGDGQWLMLQTGRMDRRTDGSTKPDTQTDRQGEILVQMFTFTEWSPFNECSPFTECLPFTEWAMGDGLWAMTDVTDRTDGQMEVLNQTDTQGEILVQMLIDVSILFYILPVEGMWLVTCHFWIVWLGEGGDKLFCSEQREMLQLGLSTEFPLPVSCW